MRATHICLPLTSVKPKFNLLPDLRGFIPIYDQICACVLFAGPNHNPVFQLCLHANCSAAPFLVSEFNEDGHLVTHNIQTTNGYTRNLIQDGTVVFVLAHNKGKWSDKFSAVEIVIDHMYLMPTPLRPTNTLSEVPTDSASSTPTTTPNKKARLTSINLDYSNVDCHASFFSVTFFCIQLHCSNVEIKPTSQSRKSPFLAIDTGGPPLSSHKTTPHGQNNNQRS